MNIKQAKEQIRNAIKAYFTKDENGDYMLPAHQQRPLFLMGPPGIGKTAVMEQVAAEMGVGLLSYSMTHHTRQSALGLPFIVHKSYQGGKIECDVSEYTMSEIIASVYDLMEETGIREGILFLDEINCVSETLAPVMLQFLQYKVFGKHTVPEGWIVVTAGNPPEYNNSVREFDIVTWDRLKRVDIEPDFDVWKEYAANVGVHPAVLTYLEIRKDDFYKVGSTVDGKTFVTARGWEDLSRMIRLYEKNGIRVDGLLMGQYLQDEKIARGFAQYYDLFQKYRSDYQVDSILEGHADESIRERARKAKFDERLSLIGLMMDVVRAEAQQTMNRNKAILGLMETLKKFRLNIKSGEPRDVFAGILAEKESELAAGKKSGALGGNDLAVLRMLMGMMREEEALIAGANDAASTFKALKTDYDSRVEAFKKDSALPGKKMNNMFLFAESTFGDGQEMLIIATELTATPACSAYIARFGCSEYFRHNKDLLLYERGNEITELLDGLSLN